ncbi:hypothetical protein COMA1_30022 [Candidatus Nitrospira nitrosa]|uniref:Uncharacterized protein n=1 Tax=Candidatus Nitrospira nitrosa TaxID=1742972 RepID=A0A0S4LFU2_9BACT|nr:hypothetical protein [Candidatus Nitrospira nitrosa]CUS36373.1 hypothetical protein COMA1_30022 [Candidatus Nitrospira nitrosa]
MKSWIDGRYGCDAAYLNSKGLTVLASDIGDILLREFPVAEVAPVGWTVSASS